jgi:hypothetical protein
MAYLTHGGGASRLDWWHSAPVRVSALLLVKGALDAAESALRLAKLHVGSEHSRPFSEAALSEAEAVVLGGREQSPEAGRKLAPHRSPPNAKGVTDPGGEGERGA